MSKEWYVGCKFYDPLYLSEALDVAFKDHKQNISHGYSKLIESNPNTINPVIIKLKYDKTQIRDIQLKHVKKI